MPTQAQIDLYGAITSGKKIPADGWWRQKLERRFWQRVIKGDGCWEFQGPPRGGKPYPIICINYVNYWVHHVAYQLQHGLIPEGLLVLHICDNGLCVRGDHLYAGTHSDNRRDAWRNGRYANRRY